MRVELTKKPLTGSSFLCLVVAVLALTGIPKSATWALSANEVEEAQLIRFDELRAASELDCEIWTRDVEVEFDPLDQWAPRLAPESEVDPSDGIFVLIFNEQRTRALHYLEAGFFIGIPTRFAPPVATFGASGDGVVRLPAAWEHILYEDETNACQSSLAACRVAPFQIFADPKFGTFFPLIGGLELHHFPDRAVYHLGRCRQGISQEFQQEAADEFADSDQEKYAVCGNWHAQMKRGAYGLLLPQPSGEERLEAYRWLRVALGQADGPDRQFHAGNIRDAIDIAAERLTADQIAKAERLAAAWEPDPAACEGQPGAESPDRRGEDEVEKVE